VVGIKVRRDNEHLNGNQLLTSNARNPIQKRAKKNYRQAGMAATYSPVPIVIGIVQ
jgi:hypothetical protein